MQVIKFYCVILFLIFGTVYKIKAARLGINEPLDGKRIKISCKCISKDVNCLIW